VPPSHVYAVIGKLIGGGILVETDHMRAQLLPRRDIAALQVNAIIHAVRGNAEDDELPGTDGPYHRQVAALLRRADAARDATLDALTLRELVTQHYDKAAVITTTSAEKRWGTE